MPTQWRQLGMNLHSFILRFELGGNVWSNKLYSEVKYAIVAVVENNKFNIISLDFKLN